MVSSRVRLTFPADGDFGVVKYAPPDLKASSISRRFIDYSYAFVWHQGWTTLADARGVVEVPEGMQIMLEITRPVDLEFLAHFEPDSIQVLHIRWGHDFPEVPCRLEPLAHLTGLKVLYLFGVPLRREDFASLARLKNLESLKLCGMDLDRKDAETLTSLARLTSLDLQYVPVDDRGIEPLRELPALEFLAFDFPRLTNAGTATFSRLPRLEELWICNAAITDPGIRAIGSLPLETLYFHDLPVSSEGLSFLGGMTSLRQLHMYKPPKDGRWLARVGTLQKLEWLSVWFSDIPAEGLDAINGLGSLQQLFFPFSKVAVEDVLARLGGLGHLKALSLHGTNVASARPLEKLSRFSELVRLDLGDLPLRSDQVQPVKTLTKLQKFMLTRTELDDRAAPAFGPLAELRNLCLRETHLTPETVENLRRQLPECEIKHKRRRWPMRTLLAMVALLGRDFGRKYVDLRGDVREAKYRKRVRRIGR